MILNLPACLRKQTAAELDVVHISSGHLFFKKFSQHAMHLKIPIRAVLFILGSDLYGVLQYISERCKNTTCLSNR